MALPAQKPAATAAPPASAAPARPMAAVPAPSGPTVRRLKRGELLFNEGDTSRAMYLLKGGMLRLFKKKGDSSIELDTVRAGQVIGELAFLDGNPRSASAEALTDCELMEISGPTFDEVLKRLPDWLKILLKTIVGRLRTASTRIRQLEQASTSVDYSDKDGKKSPQYTYLTQIDVLKISSAILLVASRNGTKVEKGIELKHGLLQRYGQQIMGVPVAKITSLTQIYAQAGLMTANDDGTNALLIVHDMTFLEQLIAYLNEENLLEASKRHDISVKGFMIMGFIAKHLAKYPVNEEGFATVNIAEIRKKEVGGTGKDPFRMEECQELVKLSYLTNVVAKSADEACTQVKVATFQHAYRVQRVIKMIESVNQQKRKQ